MTFKRIVGVMVACTFVGGAALAEPPKAKKAETKDAKKEDPMMAAMAKYSTPGPQHKMLKSMVGSWTVNTKMWMQPGKPPMESKGTAEVKALGDLWVVEEYTGDFMGKPFYGHGVHGYDLTKSKFVGSWVDSMGAYIMASEGTADASGKVVTTTANDFDPMTGKAGVVKSVTKYESDTKHTMEMFKTGPDGKDMKIMELTYTKK